MGFGIVGGDKRQVYLAKSIQRDGHQVALYGFENSADLGGIASGIDKMPLKKLLENSTEIILPLPATKDGQNLFAPFAKEEILLDDTLPEMLSQHRVYGGMMERLVASSEKWRLVNYGDYYKREELIVGNAMLTAEGALMMAIQLYPGTLNHARCLVTGFGRIGKFMCRMLRAMGANVDCAARKKKDLYEIDAIGCNAIAYKQLERRYDIIFNTVPVVVLKASQLSKQDNDTVIIELASNPGGIDLNAAERLGLRVISGQSLPGKVSPKTAGKYIKDTIYNMMEET